MENKSSQKINFKRYNLSLNRELVKKCKEEQKKKLYTSNFSGLVNNLLAKWYQLNKKGERCTPAVKGKIISNG